jgi:hypothetical protein
MPFKSKAQQKWMFANHPDMAKRWAEHTPDIKELPETVKTAAELGRYVAQMQKEAINFGGLFRSFVGKAAPAAANAAAHSAAAAVAPAAANAAARVATPAAVASAARVAERNAAATAARNAAQAARAAKALPNVGTEMENIMAAGQGIKRVAAPVGNYFKNSNFQSMIRQIYQNMNNNEQEIVVKLLQNYTKSTPKTFSKNIYKDNKFNIDKKYKQYFLLYHNQY